MTGQARQSFGVCEEHVKGGCLVSGFQHISLLISAAGTHRCQQQ